MTVSGRSNRTARYPGSEISGRREPDSERTQAGFREDAESQKVGSGRASTVSTDSSISTAATASTASTATHLAMTNLPSTTSGKQRRVAYHRIRPPTWPRRTRPTRPLSLATTAIPQMVVVASSSVSDDFRRLENPAPSDADAGGEFCSELPRDYRVCWDSSFVALPVYPYFPLFSVFSFYLLQTAILVTTDSLDEFREELRTLNRGLGPSDGARPDPSDEGNLRNVSYDAEFRR